MDIFLIAASAIAGGSLTFIVMTFLHTTSGVRVKHVHRWGEWKSGSLIYGGVSGFVKKTHMHRVCLSEECRKLETKTIKGWWQNK